MNKIILIDFFFYLNRAALLLVSLFLTLLPQTHTAKLYLSMGLLVFVVRLLNMFIN